MQNNGFMDHGVQYPQNGGGTAARILPYIPGHSRPPFTVGEALPYSPFSSVVPFNSDIIPSPSIGLQSSASIFSNDAEQHEARRSLEFLNHQYRTVGESSEQLQRFIRDAQELLQPQQLTHFKFNVAVPVLSAPNGHREDKMSLSPAAQMVFNHTKVPYTYTPPTQSSTPASATLGSNVRSTPRQMSPALVKSKKPSQTPTPVLRHEALNQQAFAHNDTINPAMLSMGNNRPIVPRTPIPGSNIYQTTILTPPVIKPEVAQQPSTGSKGQFAIVLPTGLINKEDYVAVPPSRDSSTSSTASTPQDHAVSTTIVPQVILPRAEDVINRADYVHYEDPSPSLSGKKERALEHKARYGDSEQVEKAEQAYRILHRYLGDIFEAEDMIQPGAHFTSEFFADHEGSPVLNSLAHSKLEPYLQKVIALGQFARVPVDDLARVQKLCEPSIKIAESLEVKLEVEQDWGETDVDAWIERLSQAETGLRAARTSLRVMTGGREERQLYSEESIQSALEALKNTVEGAIIPTVELRPAGSSSGLHKLLSARKKSISSTINQCRRVLLLLSDLTGKIELSETVVNTLEYLVSCLIFVENATSEKDSILGIQKFDALRVVAMDSLAQIFSSHPAQRQGIFDDILTSLEKLPSTKQSARHFKLVEGGSIQLVSALLMRLIQTSACDSGEEGNGKARAAAAGIDADMADDDDTEGMAVKSHSIVVHDPTDTENRAARDSLTAVQLLQRKAGALSDKAKSNAQYVVSFMVNRAMGTSKTGDSPYRNLLDLFVQDFITCLNSTDWPAAELLLRYVLFKMVTLAENDKMPAPAKNMALDLLGEMGAAISQLTSHVRNAVGTLTSAGDSDDLGKHLVRLTETFLDGKAVSTEAMQELISWDGPYRISMEHLDKRSTDDRAIQSAMGYRSVEWATQISTSYDFLTDDDPKHIDEEHGRLAYRLRMMIQERKWLAAEYTFKSVAPNYARLAYSVTILASEFCKSFERILMNLLNSMSSEQATVRSKSLKSVNQVLETDPTILDRMSTVIKLILRCASDSSVQVRDSALGLIGKCISLRPAIEEQTIQDILARVSDTGASVRKRAIRLLKDIYLRNTKEDVRTAIAETLLHRVSDLDESVQELARTTIEEVWMAPFYLPRDVEDDSPQYRLRVADHVRLMAKTINRSASATSVLDKVLHNMLSSDSKLAVANLRVCKTLVSTMFEAIVDNTVQGSGERLEYQDSLQLLMVFAKADPQLFTADQVQLLEPYSTNLKTKEDLIVFRAVVVIWRHVFPQLSSVHSKFLQTVRGTLLSSIQKLSKNLMDDVVACLWIVSGALDNKKNLATLTRSALLGIRKLKDVNLASGNFGETAKLSKLCLIVGLVGKHCDLDDEADFFRQGFPAMKSTSIAKLIVDTVVPFASPSQPMEVRLASLDAVGMVCQSWPRNFSSVNVFTTLQLAFDERAVLLESVILRSFSDFLKLEEKRAEPATEIPVGASIEIKATLGVMGGTAHDGVSLEIAQKFLEDITRIALATQDDHALLATEILCSINRQGLNHPKECGPALVALETSQNKTIADMAYREHRALHEKHETIMEKEYMRAVQSAFNYQRDVVKDTNGAWKDTSVSKLSALVDVLKISKPRSRKRFFESLCARTDFDLNKIDVSQDPPVHVQFSQFIAENLAFFEYSTVEDLVAAITAIERVVTGTGSTVAHAIETSVFNMNMNDQSQPQSQMVVDGEEVKPTIEPTIEPDRLRQLTAASMILSGLWEARTYLRRTYGLMHNPKKDIKSKAKDKDTNKAPVKIPFASTDKVWVEFNNLASCLASEESMKAQCKAFVELLSVDKDFKIAAEGEDEAAARQRFSTPSDDEADASMTPGSGKGRKRKGSATPSGRKKRARSGSVSKGRGRSRTKRDSPDSVDAEGEWE